MENFGKGLAVALIGCAAFGLSACKDSKKPEDKPAASAPAEPAKPAEPAPEKKSEAPIAPAANTMAAATPAEPAKADEKKPEEKAAEAPKPASEAAPTETASTTPPSADAAKSAATPETKTADATPAPSADAAKSEDVKPEDIKDRTAPPDPVSELAKQQGIKFEDGRYRNKDGDPQPIVTKDYMVDWGTWNGFRRYHDACHVCHGPNALGSTFAPALAESLKTMDYNTFIATVSSGKRENRGGTEFVMPAFGTDKNIMCYIDDIYTYIKSRSVYSASGGKEGMPPGRPNNREDISDEARKSADDCTGG